VAPRQQLCLHPELTAMFAPEIPTPLEVMDEVLAPMSPKQRDSFRSYLIGSLSVTAKPDEWARAIDVAAKCVGQESSDA
jgi:hypothetical protein